MKFDIWKRSKRIEQEFRNSLFKLCDIFELIAESNRENPDAYVEAMSRFQKSDEYEKFITASVKRMVTSINSVNATTWRKAAKKATKGHLLYKALHEELVKGGFRIMENQIIENAGLIRTLPEDVASKVTRDIAENALKGKRAKSIESIIRGQTSKHSRASARLIARTEVSKTTTALNKARCEQLGLRWYVWRTALDGNRVRKSHRNMEGVLVNWNDPPSPELLVGEKSVGYYHAGNIWNCRCYTEPILEIDDVHWPHKVYHQGRITKMTRKQFEDIL